MRSTLVIAGIGIAAGIAGLARAYPEGAPWGAADPAADEHCASCHWERKPVMASRALDIDGLPRRVDAGREYVLTLTLKGTGARTSGFQLIASAEGQPAGAFSSADADVEPAPLEAALRSTAPRPASGDMARWRFVWRAPATLAGPVTLHAAASAANDDGSPFGDEIHYRQFELAPNVRPDNRKRGR